MSSAPVAVKTLKTDILAGVAGLGCHCKLVSGVYRSANQQERSVFSPKAGRYEYDRNTAVGNKPSHNSQALQLLISTSWSAWL